MIKKAPPLAVIALLLGCESPPETPPEPVAVPRKFDRCFDAALGAATDVGVQVRSADRATGKIQGTKGGTEVTIELIRQQDEVRVAFHAPGSPETNPKLGDRWLSAYQRRMGR